MTLTKAELRVLLAVEEPITMTELASKLGLSKGTLSALLHSLEGKGLVELEGKKPMVVKPAENRVNHLLRSIKLGYPHVKMEDILTGSRLKVLSALEVEKPQPFWLVQLKANVSRATLHRVLNGLMEPLVVGRKKEGYFVSERFAPFKAFADEYFYLQNSIKAKELDPNASVVWSGVEELILATSSFKGKSVGEFQLTGLARFADFGLPLISSGVYHYYWPGQKLSLEEVIVHALKLGRDTRGLLYSIVLLRGKGFDERKLKRLAAKFDVSDIVGELLEYLSGVDKPYPFPSREEVEELCRQYFGGSRDDNKGEAG
ncbi:MarR family winged helix-turn-helix transcriptional regulator [Thermococcus sp. MV11]|uniref:MarR family winged helix-turn-helix transcriptional regulator n=1 Tax=Thermococcus sp. MV11 TaxID=1638267 RepID=UPI00142F45D4|nr:helix-turn-helix domain-containing protein [Thermococcus sp. MV11]NJE04105.1 MarR family transcriptional regulator [Thermococcus sp. MV11]